MFIIKDYIEMLKSICLGIIEVDVDEDRFFDVIL